MKDKREGKLNLILPIFSVALIFLVWAIASFKLNNEYLLPTLSQTAKEFIALFKSATFYSAFLSTLYRSLIAFLFSFVIAFTLAIISVKNSVAKRIISPFISITRALPTIAVVLLLLFWTSSKIAPVIVTTLVVMPTIFTNVENSFFSLDKTISEAGRVDGAGEIKVLALIEFPQATPGILKAIGGGISLNFKLMVAAEVLSQTANSLGFMLNLSKIYFETAKMMALVCTAVIFGVIVESLFNKLSQNLSKWK